MKRKRVNDADCPVARALDVMGDWWSLLIVRDAFDGMRRFGEFQRSLGISKGILAARLKALEAAGILALSTPAGSSRSEYVLTAKGRDLFLVIVSLRQWGERHCFAPDEPHSVMVERATERQVGPLRFEAATGTTLDADSTRVRKV